MATINFTNKKASQTLRGQVAIVTVEDDDIAKLADLEVGMVCENDSSNKTGTIHSIDLYGNSFKVSPIQPDKDFATSNGYLADDETINVTT